MKQKKPNHKKSILPDKIRMVNLTKATSISLIICLTSFSCSNQLTQNIANSGFKIKNFQENEAGVRYKGNWLSLRVDQEVNLIDDVSSGFVNRWSVGSTETYVENTDTFIGETVPDYKRITYYPYSSWFQENDTGATGGSYHYNSGVPFDVVQNKKALGAYSERITYSGSGTWDKNGDYDFNLGVPLVNENNSGNITYYGSFPWNNYIGGDGTNYHYTRNLDGKLEYTFHGTNTTIKMGQYYNRSKAKITIYKIKNLSYQPLNASENLVFEEEKNDINNYYPSFRWAYGNQWKYPLWQAS